MRFFTIFYDIFLVRNFLRTRDRRYYTYLPVVGAVSRRVPPLL